MITKLSAKTGTPVRKLCMERLKELGITEAELTEALDPARMTKPDAGMVGAGGGKTPNWTEDTQTSSSPRSRSHHRLLP